MMRAFAPLLLMAYGLGLHVAAQAVINVGKHRIPLEEGDFIFRSGVGKESDFVRDFSFVDKTFTHVGIVLKEKNTFRVYHMLGGISSTGCGLRKDSVNTFIRYPDNECFGIYHASLSKIQIAWFKKYIDSIDKRGVAFDMHFRLNNKDSLYCTEMIIEGLKYASQGKIVITPQKINLAATRYRKAFDADQGTILFYPVDVLQHASFLRKKVIVFYPNYKVKKTG